MSVIIRDPIPCPAPGCGRMFRPNHRQRSGCSTFCVERLRIAAGLLPGQGGVLVHPSWKKGAA